ncbi:MAG: ABC transporter ATP-binding protein [Acidimicrobiales bacterium]|jgi:peptide/nickel transport system ATP-binding protein
MIDASKVPAQLAARNLTRHFSVRTPGHLLRAKRIVRAVDDVSLDLVAGEVVAVVGESGSGKSVLARMLARIVTPTSGDLVLQGTPIAIKSKRTLAYASQVQLVLQDPFASMNPVHRMSHNLIRPLRIHGASEADAPALAEAALRRVSLEPPSRFLESYPHELSGGQLQRISIARALCIEPKVLLADEPISMLDVSVRLGVLNLLRGLCEDDRLAILYITHDIASARYIADSIIVMYAGQVVEQSRGTSLVDEPTHPYTQLLIASVPDPSDPTRDVPPTGEHAQIAIADKGCRFNPRCPHVMDRCRQEEPPAFRVGDNHTSKCWLYADHEVAVEVALSTRRREGETATT